MIIYLHYVNFPSKCTIETCTAIKHLKTHIHLPQQAIFLEIWSCFVFYIAGLWIMQNVMCLSKHWCCNEGTGKHFVLSCVFIGDETEIISLPLSGSICVFVCLSDPSVAPSPASRFSTPYQKRERTLNARMYHPCQFSFHFSFLVLQNKPLID